MRIKIIILIIIAAVIGVFLINRGGEDEIIVVTGEPAETAAESVKVIAEGLEIPWDIAFLPYGDLLVTERPGRLVRIDVDGTRTQIPVESVRHAGEGGLLGLVLHPNFTQNNWLYIYLSSPEAGGETINRVEQYKLVNNILTKKKIIIDNIPGAPYHDGGRIEFGPDDKLYISTGDATRPEIAQDLNSLGGKILRLNENGTSEVYSYGHRNPQGLAWDNKGNLWETEHGPSAVVFPNCCQDELNLIKPGANYGWPDSVGDKVLTETIAPALHSGRDTWAPASLVYWKNPDASVGAGSLFFGGLKGEALYEAVLDGDKVRELKTHFKNEFGRIRTVRIGPDNMLYITTSNRDGRGAVRTGDDKIIRINPRFLD
ncbi:MAG: PQQ-dependent sugar dehydrogenase [Candidatus Colwellbacteria bacterium]|nr:PQQ-dependent sugar dehydrogenase [Candidatus Colwellbacteria bacterium]